MITPCIIYCCFQLEAKDYISSHKDLPQKESDIIYTWGYAVSMDYLV